MVTMTPDKWRRLRRIGASTPRSGCWCSSSRSTCGSRTTGPRRSRSGWRRQGPRPGRRDRVGGAGVRAGGRASRTSACAPGPRRAGRQPEQADPLHDRFGAGRRSRRGRLLSASKPVHGLVGDAFGGKIELDQQGSPGQEGRRSPSSCTRSDVDMAETSRRSRSRSTCRCSRHAQARPGDRVGDRKVRGRQGRRSPLPAPTACSATARRRSRSAAARSCREG